MADQDRVTMRTDTELGPVWLVPDKLGEQAAKHVARLDLLWPDLDSFTAMHTGPPSGGAFVVRAPRAALEARGLPTGSAAEVPVAEGSCWPPIQEETKPASPQPNDLDALRKEAMASAEYVENGPVMRSCWECNGAHEHLRDADYLIWCFGCGKFWFKGIDISIYDGEALA